MQIFFLCVHWTLSIEYCLKCKFYAKCDLTPLFLKKIPYLRCWHESVDENRFGQIKLIYFSPDKTGSDFLRLDETLLYREESFSED